MRRVFKIRTFARWARKAGIPARSLCTAVDELARGQIDADLGGQAFKQRIPIPGRGKRGGGRVIVGANLQDR